MISGAAALRANADPRLDIGHADRTRRVAAPSELDAPPPVLRVMTLNLAHGRRVSKHQSLLSRRRLADNLAAAGDLLYREAPDVVALQEADGPSVWSGYFDHVESLAAYSDYDHVHSGVHASMGWPFKLQYGTALLGRVPLSKFESVSFNDNWRDSKGFVVATVLIPGMGDTEIDVVSVHLDFLRPAVRERQVETMISSLSGRNRPLVVLGDLNCDSDARAWARLISGLQLHPPTADRLSPTYPSGAPKTRIDWVLISDDLQFSSHRVLSDRVSDHRSIIAEIGQRLSSRSHP